MESRGKPPSRRGYDDHPSFSSSLLDAIYRSIDESDGGAPVRAAAPVTASKKHPASAEKWVSERKASAGASNPTVTRRKAEKKEAAELHQRRKGRGFWNSTSSSSDGGSSYGGFSSSEAESVAAGPVHSRLKPIRTGLAPSRRSDLPPFPPPSAISSPAVQEKKKPSPRSSSIRSKIRDLRRSPVSPGARLAGFLNSLFASSAGNPKKPKSSACSPAGFAGGEESACSTASASARSCMSQTPSSRGRPAAAAAEKRSVRFCPVSVIVDEDLRPCGEKRLGGQGPPPEAALRRPPAGAKTMVEDLLRGLEEEEEEEEAWGSDTSSDLFELENLTAIGEGRSGYRDELPVYETTHLRTNRAIAQGFVV